jgi:hypothetical protein
MKRVKRKMEPHMEKYSSPDGQLACVLISIAAAAVVGGKESKENLKSVTRLASEISGIPIGAMTAHADFSLAMNAFSMKAQQTSTIGGGGENA